MKRSTTAFVLVLCVVVSLLSARVVPVTATAAPAATCPDLHILAVQGTSQSSSKAPTKQDQGMLASVIMPVLAAQATDKGLRVDRTYIPYRANFGDSGSNDDYRDSAGEGLNRLSQIANRVITQCPATKLAVIGYSQGGHVVDAFGHAVAAGQGSITPDMIAMIMTFGSPTRGPDAALFPGASGQVAPKAVPGIGDLKPSVFADQLNVAKGQGIGPDTDRITDFGPLNGRVADFCIPGDLACAAPRSASLLKLGSNIVEQSNFDYTNDPTGSVGRMAAAFADTAVRGVSTIINTDIGGNSLADLSINPSASISQRLAEVSAPAPLTPTTATGSGSGSSNASGSGGLDSAASDAAGTDSPTSSSQGSGKTAKPAVPVGADNPLRAIARLGSIAFNTVTSFVSAMLTPENIASMVAAGTSAITAAAGAGTANPIAGGLGAAGTATAGASLASNTLNAAMQAVPPATAVTAVSSLFNEIVNEVKTNADLPAVVFDARTWNQVAYHGGYQKTPVSSTGASATKVAADWLITAAKAYAAARVRAQTPPPAPKPSGPAPTAPYTLTPGTDKAAPTGAIAVATKPVTSRGDHVLLADNTRDAKPASSTPGALAPISVAIDNTALTEAQRVEVAADPRFVRPNAAQRLARYGTIALSDMAVSAA